jgi:hypothetical protein
MNRIIYIIFVVLTITLFGSLQAQKKAPHHFDKKAFVSTRNAYIIAEVGLSPDEAAVFIPLSNELLDKKYEIDRSCRKYFREIKKKRTPTEAEYAEAVDCYLRSQIEIADLEKDYYNKFKKILSPEKVYKFRRAEIKFIHDFMQKRGRKK